MERGTRRKIDDQIREWICLIARTSPAECGITGISTWSLTSDAMLCSLIGGTWLSASCGSRGPGRCLEVTCERLHDLAERLDLVGAEHVGEVCADRL